MFKILKYTGTTILALAIFVLILPYFVSLNSYKGEAVTQAQKALGRDLIIEGDIKFRILPRPYLKLKKLKLASIKGTQEPIMASLKEVEVVLSILPLFSGKIEVAKVILESPEITLEKLKSGKANWDFDVAWVKPLPPKEELLANGGTALDSKTDSSFHVQIIKIKDGALRYIDDGKTTELKGINLTLDMDSFKGPMDFDLELKLHGNDLSIEGRLKEIGEQIPIEAKIKALGEKLHIGGIIDVSSARFKGDLELKGSLKNLKDLMPDLDLPSSLTDKYRLNANVSANANKISLENIEFNLSPLSAKGSLDVDLKKMVGSLKLDLMPGNVSIELHPDAPKKDEFSGSIRVNAKDVSQLLKGLKIETKDLPAFLLKEFSFATKVTYRDQKIDLRAINLNAGKANLVGQINLENWDEDGRYSFDVRTKDLYALGRLLDASLPKSIGAAKITGKASGKPDDLSLDIALYAANAHTTFKGSVKHKDTTIKPALTITTSGKSLQSTLRALGQDKPSKALGGFRINARINGDIPQRVKADFHKSHLTIGRDRVDLKGSVDVFLTGSKPKITVDLSLSSLDMDRLMASFSQGTPAPQPQLHLVAKGGKSSKKSPSTWSHKTISLAILRDFDGDIAIAIPAVRSGDLVFDSLKLNARVANGILDLTSLKGGLYGGNLTLKGRLSSQKDQPISMTVHLKDAKLKNILPKQKEIKVVSGLFSLDADLTTLGHSEYQYVSNLGGSINFKGTKGAISGFDLQKIVNDLTNVSNLGAALSLMNDAFSGGQTAFNSIDCITTISKGEARIKKFLLDAVGADVTADGTVNLLRYVMDISAKVTLEGKDLPPFSARIYGPLNDPKTDLKTGQLEAYLVKNVLSGVTDVLAKGIEKPADLLKGALGLVGVGNTGSNDAAPSKPTPNQPQQDTPAKEVEDTPIKEVEDIGKAVGGLLKGLF